MGGRTNAMHRDPGRALHALCQLVALPEGTGAVEVADALKASITTLPAQLRRSLTWDQGSEMAVRRRFSVEAGLPVYFCDPRSPWQRGWNREHQRPPSPVLPERARASPG